VGAAGWGQEEGPMEREKRTPRQAGARSGVLSRDPGIVT